jgi:hypothetical protein
LTEDTKTADRLLANYRMLGIGAILSFLGFIALLLVFYLHDNTDSFFLFFILTSGFLWIGMTSLCRHVLIKLKFQMGSKVSIVEFLLTQLIVFLFPFYYSRLKKEVALYKDKLADKHVTSIRS